MTNVYGRLTSVGEQFRKPVGNQGRTALYVRCLCSCGTEKTYAVGDLKSGHTQSCGCLKKERITKCKTIHGHSAGGKLTFEYSSWRGMMQRCLNTANAEYKNYGGRGIKVCERWLDFRNFFEDMGNAPEWADSLDRKDCNGNYCHENCRWSNMKEQQNNRRNNRLISAFGKTQTVAQWAYETNMSYKTLHSRLEQYNWSAEKALTTKVKRPQMKPSLGIMVSAESNDMMPQKDSANEFSFE